MNKDDATWLKMAYMGFGVVVGFLVYKALYTLSIQMEWEERYFEWLPYVRGAATLLGGVIGYLYISSNQERHSYFLASLGELRKVTWPTIDDTKKMTMVVVVVVAIFSFVLWVFDVIWSKSLSLILS